MWGGLFRRVNDMMVVYSVKQAKTSPTFKDNDFIQREEKISIGDDARTKFFAKLERDIAVSLSLSLHSFPSPPLSTLSPSLPLSLSLCVSLSEAQLMSSV